MPYVKEETKQCRDYFNVAFPKLQKQYAKKGWGQEQDPREWGIDERNQNRDKCIGCSIQTSVP